jgi:prepilin-type N-terminal cleavage/methylation domain-containing protein
VRAIAIRHRQGFTLIELMVVVSIIGVLAAIAIPAFQGYQYRSRRAESFTNLTAIAKLEKSYFSEYSAYVSAAASPGPAPTTEKRAWDAASELRYATIGWRPEGPVYYDYDVETGINCPDRDCFTATAYGDADGDGFISIVQYVQPSASGATEDTAIFGYPPPVEAVSGRIRLNEAAVNYAADSF